MSKIRTEISIESNESYIVRRKRHSIRSWCSSCGRVAILVLPSEAAFLAGLEIDKIVELVCNGTLHVTEFPQRGAYICLTSLCFIEQFDDSTNDEVVFDELQIKGGSAFESELLAEIN